ncbi:CHASE2 domain-containing protein [Leptothoe sp. PORK10 BA2]|uniref:CHASE2 domain-containing protein n=1 Tax=Leptothoe sp. PORK10 BA2 TaxID=3110254 RepID=UPI002B1EAE02|nr:CHASE2 domain-containing protein [Leptothoe sp. PORK10 BA2]MEA5465502.1 CHASE2 domain-containing protein [Leptothoe sp. PORK10 BA2]
MVPLVKTDTIRDVWSTLWQNLRNPRGFVILTSVIAASSILAIRSLGGLQPLELRVFDKMMALRPLEPSDPRLVIVGITDADIDNYLDAATINDQTMADLIRTVRSHQPRVIGLDFYRNLPNEPGTKDLEKVFEETPNLIGIEKVIEHENGHAIPGNHVLKTAGQLAASDIVVDRDGRVRRGLLFPSTNSPDVLEGLGLRLALDYLGGEKIPITPEPDSSVLTLNQAPLLPVERHTGGYVDVDAGGYQLLLNLRQHKQAFDVVSLKQVLENQFPPEMMRDRIVLIGNMALSDADIFYTASRYEKNEVPIQFGVEIHGEIASQIISYILDGRALIHTWPTWLESALILGIAIGGGYLTQRATKFMQRLTFIPGASLLVLVGSYGTLSWTGLWLPVVPMLLGLWLASGLAGAHRINQLQMLSANDKLTGLANRRTFDESLQQRWFKALKAQHPLTLIIGDVDHFKKYNDTYGHPQGDECLKRVAQAIRTSVKSKDALIARYGGEEFVLLLPNKSVEEGIAIAQAILAKLDTYALPHDTSDTADHVTMSLGITSLIPKLEIPPSALVEMADLGLYAAKKSGRNQVRLHQLDTLDKIL